MEAQTIKKILEEEKIKPLSELGQHFLVNKKGINFFVELANQGSSARMVLEIGPGLGAITAPLIKEGFSVIALEKDKKLAKILKGLVREMGTQDLTKNLQTTHQDALKFNTEKIKKEYLLISNLPFYITGDVLEKFLIKEKNKPKKLILGVQKEVAEKIVAEPPSMNSLSLMIGLMGKSEIKGEMPPNYFWPQPPVWTSIVEINVDSKTKKAKSIFRDLRPVFRQSRKTLPNAFEITTNFSKDRIKEALKQLKISPKIRAEGLSVNQWLNLYEKIN